MRRLTVLVCTSLVAACGARTAPAGPETPAERDAGVLDAGRGDAGTDASTSPDAGTDGGSPPRCDVLLPSEVVTTVFEDTDDFALPFALIRTPAGLDAYARYGDRIEARALSPDGLRLGRGPVRTVPFRFDGATSQGGEILLCTRTPPSAVVVSGPGFLPVFVRDLRGTTYCHTAVGDHDQWLIFTNDAPDGSPARMRYSRYDRAGAALGPERVDFRSLTGGPRSVRAASATRDGFAWVSTGPYGRDDVEVSSLARTGGEVQSARIETTVEAEAIAPWPYRSPGLFAIAASAVGGVRVHLVDARLAQIGVSSVVDPNHCRYALATGDFGLALVVESSGPGDQTTRVYQVGEALELTEVASFERARTGCGYLGVESDGHHLVLYAREEAHAVAWLLSCFER